MAMRVDLPLDIDRKLFEQLDFALIRTFTKAGQVAQKAVKRSLPNRFTLRNNFVENSIRFKAATKNSPFSTVYVPTEKSDRFNADFMLLQETGGIKTPTKKTHLAIPVGVKKRKGIIADRDRPAALLASGGYNSTRRRQNRVFVVDENTPPRYRHDLPFGIYASHPNRKDHKKGNQGLTMLYRFEKRAPVSARFNFFETAVGAAQDALPSLFDESLIEALRTAR